MENAPTSQQIVFKLRAASELKFGVYWKYRFPALLYIFPMLDATVPRHAGKHDEGTLSCDIVLNSTKSYMGQDPCGSWPICARYGQGTSGHGPYGLGSMA